MYAPRQEFTTYMSRPQLFGGFGDFARASDGLTRGPPPQQYGSAAPMDFGGLAKASRLFALAQRQRLNVLPMCHCFLLPWLYFCATYAMVSFQFHYTSPGLCWALVYIGLAAVLVLSGYAAFCAWRKHRAMGSGLYASDAVAAAAQPPSWLSFLAISLLAAWILGVVLGNLNFWTNMQPYYDYTNLNEHTVLDPSKVRGQEFMDAGRVHFTNTSALDLRWSMGFRNLDTYCVAPITVRSPASGSLQLLESYDFWAVGLGCCHTHVADFHCGEFDNPQAHQGLRLLKDEQRSFFRLAVQQAEATYSIKASHPLFFYWVADATAEMDSFRDEGYKYFLIGMLVHFAWQLLCVMLAACSFAKLGKL